MARTPQRTFDQDFTVVSGDAITGDDATGGAGGTLILEGGDAASGTNTDGGNVTLRPGLEDGSGTLGEVEVTNRTGTEDDAILAITSASGNSHTFRMRTGTVQPNSDSVPASAGGDLYVRSDGTLWIASASGTGNWVQLAAGGTVTLEGAVENTGATDANMNQSFDWRVTDSDTLEFSNSDGSNPLLTVAPAAAGDNLTLGGTATSSTITAHGPTTGTGFFTITHGGADTVPLMTWTTSGGGGDSIQVFTGSSSPNGRVTGAIGSLFLDGTNGKAWVNTDGSTTWTDLTATGSGADAGIPGVIYGKNLAGTDTEINKLYMDAGDRNSYPGSGTTVTDLTGSRSGTKTTSVQVQNGHFEFDGSSGSINFGTDASIENIWDGGGTLVVWFRADGAGEANLGRVAGTANSANNFGWFLCVDSPSGSTYKMLFRQNFSGAPAYGDWNTTSTLNLYEWYCFALAYDSDDTGNDPTFYINGVLETANQITTPGGARVTDNGYPFVVGNRSTNDDRTWDGAIDMVMLFDEELSAEEIRQIYRVTGEDRLRASLVGSDAVTATGNAQDVEVRAGDGGSTSGSGGDVVLRPGDVTSGTRGIVKATHVGADTDPVLQLETTGTNGEDVRVFVGDQDPDGTITGNPGDVYLTHSGTSSTINVNTGAGDSNTTWTDLTSIGTVSLEGAVENTGATDANMDQSFDWRITDSDTLEFSNSDGSNPLLTIAPAAAGDNVTVGGTEASSTVTIQGPTTGTGFCTVTHGGADTVPLMAWTTSGSGGDSVQVFTGSSSPNGRVTGAVGSFFLEGTAGSAWVNTDGSTTWVDLSAGSGAASPGIEGVVYGAWDGVSANAVVNKFYADAGDINSYSGSGSTWTDIMGSRSGSMTGIEVTDGHFLFDGGTDRVSFTMDSGIQDIFDGGGTLLAWVRADGAGGGNLGRVVGTANDANTLGWFLFLGDPSGSTWVPYFRQNWSTNEGSWKTSSSLNLDEWYLIAVTYDSDSTANDPSFYVNGILTASTEVDTPSGTLAADDSNLIVGNRPATDRGWNGPIDMVMLFDEALSEAEIKQIYHVTQDRLRPSLVGFDASDVSRPAQPVEILGGRGGTTSGAGGPITITAGESTAASGGDVSVTAGASNGGTTGGDVSIAGGDVASTNYSAGDVTINGGDLNYASAITPNRTGSITLESGSYGGTGSALVGGITIKTGTGGVNSGNANDITLQVTSYASSGGLGDIVLQGGDNTGSGAPSNVQILGGDASADPGGSITLTAGDGTGVNQIGGAISLTSGGASAAATGTITIQVPAQSASGRGTGDIGISIGDTASNYGSNPSGNINITGGDHTGTTGTAAASDVNITAGDHAGNENNSPPGDITLSAGDQTGSGQGPAGSIYIWAGDKTAGSHSTTAGGQIDIDAGDGSGVGPGGAVHVTAGVAGSTGTGGAVDIDAGGSGSGATGTGGAVTIDGGTCNATNGAGGAITVTSGAGAGTGNGGAVAISGNDGGATSGTGGATSLSSGQGGGSGAGGACTVQSGPGGATGAGGLLSLAGGPGGSTSGAGGGITVSAGDATSGSGGGITATAGDAGTSGDGGSITLTAGSLAGIGSAGNVMAYADDGGAFRHRTQTSGFTSTFCEHKTQGLQVSTSGTVVLAVLGVLGTDGLNMKFDVKCTGVRDSNDSDIISIHAVQTAYRASGTVSLLTAHVDPTTTPGKQTNGTIPWTNVLLAVNGNNIELQAVASVATGDWNFSIEWTRQLGGYSS